MDFGVNSGASTAQGIGGIAAGVGARRMRCAGRALPVVVALLAGCATPAHDPALEQRVEAAIAPLVAAHEFSGAIVLARRGQVVYQRGFGLANQAAVVAFTPDTPSDGGSLAKTFTAAGLWWLAHEGRIEIDAPVTRYLPQYPHAQTTVRQLIDHSNGLPAGYAFFDPHFGADELRATEAMLAAVARAVPVPAFVPGARFEYSSFGFDVAALLIERVSGQRFEAFVGGRFFEPLDMRSSFARPARLADWQGVRTLGYRWRDGAWQVVDVYDREAFLGGSNFHFSTADLARWASAHALGHALPRAAFEAGQQRSRIGGQLSPMTGLSWYCDDSGNRCYYTGSLNAFHGLVYWDRVSGDAAAFMSNSSLPPWRVIGLQRELVAALARRSAKAEPPTGFERFDRKTRAAIAGTYVAEGLGVLTVRMADGRPRLRIGEGLEFDLFPVSREVFYAPGPDYWLAFSGGQTPAALHLRSMFVDVVARRRGG
jgi:CubicO group peptidase (beta-lactamase class C family)